MFDKKPRAKRPLAERSSNEWKLEEKVE